MNITAMNQLAAALKEPPELFEYMEAHRPLISSVTPLLDLYPGVDAGDLLPALLEDPIEYIEATDIVLWEIPGMINPRDGVVIQTFPAIEYCIVEFQFGARRKCHIDEI